jgi:plastocyanin
MKKINFLSILFLSFVLIITYVSCSKDDAGGTAPNKVSITDNAFSSSITVAQGTTVTWTNFGAVDHTVTSDVTGATGFDSGTIAPGAVFTHTFTTTGTFAYHCNFHSSMAATVTVTP